MIDSDRLRQALANALESNEGIPPARNGRATIDGVEYTAVPVAELEELRAMKKRAQECSTWCGRDEMHRAVRYIETGEITP